MSLSTNLICSPCLLERYHSLKHHCAVVVEAKQLSGTEPVKCVLVFQQMTIIVVSDSFFQTVWIDDEFRTLLLSKLESQRHRFLLVYLGNDVIKDNVNSAAPDRKQFYDSSSVYPRLSAADCHFAGSLIDYLPPSGRYRSDSVETEESVALISDDDRCRHERY